MVKVTEKYLFRKFEKKPQIQSRKRGETDKEYLNRITHLYLQSQFVDYIAPMTDCTSVSVVYLQNNQLQTIHNMENFPNLSHLHLQRNNISKMENLNCLKNLRKLYLGSNEISVLEGLENLENLTELHLEGQRLPEGDTIYFDPRTIRNLAKTLKVLNISNNKISSIQGISGMTALHTLIAGDNRIEDVDEVVDTVASLAGLAKLTLAGNPIASNRRYREALTLASSSIRVLDEREITLEARTFVENLVLTKESRQRQKKADGPNPPTNTFPETVKQRKSHVIDKAPQTISGSKLFPLLKAQIMKMPRTVSTFSANVPPHYFHKSLRALQYIPSSNPSILNYK